MRHRLLSVTLATSLSVVPLAGCSTTYDESLVEDTTPSTTTTLPTGTTTELLERLRDQSLELSALIIDRGGSREAYEAMAALWDAARADVVAQRPDLVDGFDRALAMCQKAVQYKRGADADKAARNIGVLVDAWTA